jgi:hypothetical protein
MDLPSAIVRRGSIFLPSWDASSSIISLGGRMLSMFYPRHPDIKMICYESCASLTVTDRVAERTACAHKFFGFN